MVDAVIAIVADPTDVHALPSADSYPVKVLPLRTNFTQRGGADVDPVRFCDAPPVDGRHCSATPFGGDTSIRA